MLLLTLTMTVHGDIGDDGDNIIMQTNIETILITAELSPIKGQLISLMKQTQNLQAAAVIHQGNKLGKESGQVNKMIYNTLQTNNKNVQTAAKHFSSLIESYSETSRAKRAIEILGSFLSTLTGVPSARDHRRILEQVKMIRLESKGIENLMKDQNIENSKILKAMHFHSTEIKAIDNEIGQLHKETAKNKADILRTLAVLSIISKTSNAINDIDEITGQVRATIALSDQEKLSRHSISPKNLAGIIDKIHLKRDKDAPIFSREQCNKYFELPLAHSWLDQGTLELNTLLQIPIAKLHIKSAIRVLDVANIVHSDLPLAVVNAQANTYRLLSNSDLRDCIQSDQTKICQKREITISPAAGCSIKLRNCDKWATHVVHDITNSDILIISDDTEKATIRCDNQPAREVNLSLIHI